MLGKLKTSLLRSIILALAFSTQVFSSGSLLFGAERDFKCYIELSNTQAIIKNQFATSPEQAKSLLMSWFANKSQQIIAIKECVKIQNDFSFYEAHKLDLNTPQ